MINPESAARLSVPGACLPLSEVGHGCRVRIAALPAQWAADLVAEGLGPGALAVPEVQAPLGGPLLVRVGRSRVAISAAVARQVLVEPEADELR